MIHYQVWNIGEFDISSTILIVNQIINFTYCLTIIKQEERS